MTVPIQDRLRLLDSMTELRPVQADRPTPAELVAEVHALAQAQDLVVSDRFAQAVVAHASLPQGRPTQMWDRPGSLEAWDAAKQASDRAVTQAKRYQYLPLGLVCSLLPLGWLGGAGLGAAGIGFMIGGFACFVGILILEGTGDRFQARFRQDERQRACLEPAQLTLNDAKMASEVPGLVACLAQAHAGPVPFLEADYQEASRRLTAHRKAKMGAAAQEKERRAAQKAQNEARAVRQFLFDQSKGT